MNFNKKSKELAFLLRHDPNYEFDKNGWRKVRDLIDNHRYTRAELEYLVENDNKGRYEFNEDKKKIRARQGHSIAVDVELEEKEPPMLLYHGTSSRFIDQILKEGIKKMNRLYVQLSEDIETAKIVGERHGGSLIIFKIPAKAMYDSGIKFFLSRNGVWMTEFVDPKYLDREWI